MIARALKFVRFDRIEDHFRQGWMVTIPNAMTHHHHYGVEMKWICNCPVPGGFKGKTNERNHRQQHQGTAQEHCGAD